MRLGPGRVRPYSLGGLCWLCCSNACLRVFSFLLWCPLRFQRNNTFDLSVPPFSFYTVDGSIFIDVICIYLRILVSNTISISDGISLIHQHTVSVTGEAATTYCSRAPGFIWCFREILTVPEYLVLAGVFVRFLLFQSIWFYLVF